MSSEWSDMHKIMQEQLKKENSFEDGIRTLLVLRQELLNEIISFKEVLTRTDFNAIPFIHAKGYHSKTIAYSLWHIFRIEDIVVHSLILGDEQIFFAEDYQKRINAPIITTGNELVKDEIAKFSEVLNLEELYQYILRVNESTAKWLRELTYFDSKVYMTEEKQEYLRTLRVVSEDENAYWLIDYWCKKNIKGLIQMPLSRHWIMHVEASLRIKHKISAS